MIRLGVTVIYRNKRYIILNYCDYLRIADLGDVTGKSCLARYQDIQVVDDDPTP